jgi:HAD superfamily hydrolase (TIGR01509 family)
VNFHGFIFDVDGTLVDSNNEHAQAFVDTFQEFGSSVPFEKVRPLIGMGADKLIPELIGRYDEALAERKKTIFMTRYLPAVRAFPQVPELLDALRSKGVKLAVASSASKDELDALLQIAQAERYLDEAADSEDAGRSKPDPDIVHAAVRKLALPAQRCVMVGDTPYDAQAAHRAGVPFIGVRCGGWDERSLEPSIDVYDDPADLARFAR